MGRPACALAMVVVLLTPSPICAADDWESERQIRSEAARTRWEDREYQQAIELLSQLLEGDRRNLARDDQRLWETLEQLSGWQLFVDAFQAARRLREELLALQIDALGADYWTIVGLRLAVAEVDLFQALQPAQRDGLRRAYYLAKEARHLIDRQRYPEAYPLAREVWDIRRRVLGNENMHTAFAADELAKVAAYLGRFEESEGLFVEALATLGALFGEEHPDYALTLSNYCFHLRVWGRLSEARAGYVRTREILQVTYGSQHREVTTVDLLLGLVAMDMGHFAEARQRIESARGSCAQNQGTQCVRYAEILTAQGRLLDLQGDYEGAKQPYNQALELQRLLRGEQHVETGIAVHNVALIHQRLRDYDVAEKLYQRALDIFRAHGAAAKASYMNTLRNLTNIYRDRGELERAARALEEVIAFQTTLRGSEAPAVARAISDLGVIYHHQGRLEEAVDQHVQALTTLRTALGTQHTDVAAVLHNLGHAHRARKDLPAAEAALGESVAIMSRQLELAANVQSPRQQLAMLRAMRYFLDAYLALAVDGGAPAEKAYAYVLQWKGSVLARQQMLRARIAHPELADTYRRLAEVTSTLSRAALAAPQGHDRDAWRQEISNLSQEKDRLERELAAGSGEFQAARSRASLDAWKQTLPEDVVLFDSLRYWHFPLGGRYLAFRITRDAAVEIVSLGDYREVETTISRWHERNLHPDERRELGDQLRSLVWDPLTRDRDGITVALVSPEAELGRVPFAALPLPASEGYLIDEVAIAMVPAPQHIDELVSHTNQNAQSGALLVVGGVDYERTDVHRELEEHDVALAEVLGQMRSVERDWYRRFRALPGTAEEIEAVRTTFELHRPAGAVHLLLGAEATEARLSQLATQHRYLHLATHGYFAPPSLTYSWLAADESLQSELQTLAPLNLPGLHPGMLSGLALAGANADAAERPGEAQYDGIWTAEEVSVLDLSQCELCVLSACETALGAEAPGEGLLGLQRAFQVAGARTTVATLRAVSDRGTRLLMERFYDNLWRRGLGKLESLREAQIWMRREVAPRDLHGDNVPVFERADAELSPLYWGVFILSGDWR